MLMIVAQDVKLLCLNVITTLIQ